MSLQPRVHHLTKIISDAPSKLARCLPSKVRELLTKKWESKLLSASVWNKIIVISCAIAISLDPLFLYIPFIDEKKRCLGMDKKLWNVALILRSLTDITFLVDIGYKIYEGINKAYKEINQGKEQWELDWQTTLIRRHEIIPFAKKIAWELKWCCLVTDLLSVFPMPQLLVKGFSKMWSGYSKPRKAVNFFLLSQYLPRIYRIILSSTELTRTIGIWVKALFNLFLYIIASHVIGAFWYFFSIQRETTCWHQACQNQTNTEGCMGTFSCDHHNTSTPNITFFDEHCKIDVPDDAAPFKYGIFLDSLKSGNAEHINFPTKLCYSFWWGLRNLSNFGTNLATSNYVWENLFAILISVTGMLLFIYLIGNIQTFIQMRTTRSEEIRKKIELKKGDIEEWMKKYHIDDRKKDEIMKNINKKLEEDKDSELENLFNVVPGYMKKYLKHLLCFKTLSQVRLLKLMNDNVLKTMCDYMTPVTYAAGHVIFSVNEPIDRMLLIIEGKAIPYRTTPNSSFARGEETTENSGAAPFPSPEDDEGLGKVVYAEKLLMWASAKKPRFGELPLGTENVKCLTKVEGFTLSAQDLLKVVSEREQSWKLYFGH